MSGSLEITSLRLGFIPLNDCAPLVVAAERGLFEDEGLSVSLSREASWANVRDKVAVGLLDGAHMLGPMPIASTLGLSGPVTPMIAPFSIAYGPHAAERTAAFCASRPPKSIVYVSGSTVCPPAGGNRSFAVRK